MYMYAVNVIQALCNNMIVSMHGRLGQVSTGICVHVHVKEHSQIMSHVFLASLAPYLYIVTLITSPPSSMMYMYMYCTCNFVKVFFS